MANHQFEVELPAGGKLQLRSQDEVTLWEQTANRYKQEYSLTKTNDLISLGILLSQHLNIHRAQSELNGMVPQVDAAGKPTGRYIYKQPEAADVTRLSKLISDASKDIRDAEKSLGIDKKTRDSGGGETLANYIQTLKTAGRSYGLHITRRTKAYEEFAMELRWKLRVLRNADEEDRRHHNISEATICEFAEQRLGELEEIDRKYANEKQSLFVGKL